MQFVRGIFKVSAYIDKIIVCSYSAIFNLDQIREWIINPIEPVSSISGEALNPDIVQFIQLIPFVKTVKTSFVHLAKVNILVQPKEKFEA